MKEFEKNAIMYPEPQDLVDAFFTPNPLFSNASAPPLRLRPPRRGNVLKRIFRRLKTILEPPQLSKEDLENLSSFITNNKRMSDVAKPSEREQFILKVENLLFTLALRAEQKNVAESISYSSDIKKLLVTLYDLAEARKAGNEATIPENS